MAQQWLKLPHKQATCSLLTTCKVPTVATTTATKFLGNLKRKGFDEEGLSVLSNLLKHKHSGGQAGGNKTRRLCAIVIVGLIASGVVILSKSALHQSLIQTGLLPQLCGTSFLERLAHDYIAGEIGGVLTCDQKAALWRHSANSILAVVTAAGIGPRMILSNFNAAVTQVEGLIDEWIGGAVPALPESTRGSSPRKSPSKSVSPRSKKGSSPKKAAAEAKKTKKQRGRSRSRSKSRSRSRSRSKAVAEAMSKMLTSREQEKFDSPAWKFDHMKEQLHKMKQKVKGAKKSPRHSRKLYKSPSRKASSSRSRSRSKSSDGSSAQ